MEAVHIFDMGLGSVVYRNELDFGLTEEPTVTFSHLDWLRNYTKVFQRVINTAACSISRIYLGSVWG